jgi:hypothetical protein
LENWQSAPASASERQRHRRELLWRQECLAKKLALKNGDCQYLRSSLIRRQNLNLAAGLARLVLAVAVSCCQGTIFQQIIKHLGLRWVGIVRHISLM